MSHALEVICSPYTGYCFGVKRAMRLIERGLIENAGKMYTLGHVIHNPQAVKRLKSRGVIPVDSLDEIGKGDTLVIRAHGSHPDIINEARKRGIRLIDATCPFVQRSQQYVGQLTSESCRVIIIGDGEHPEVKGILGHTGGNAIIIESVKSAENMESLDKAGVVIQTTFARERATEIIEEIEKHVKNLRVFDTICQATILRREATENLAKKVDIMLVVGGRGSSNTRRLFQMCIDAGVRAEFIETAEEIRPSFFEGCRTVGLTTGTSTPGWIIEKVLERMENISRGNDDGSQ